MTIRVLPVTMFGMLLCACAASPQKPPVAVAAAAAVTRPPKPAAPNYEIAELDGRAKQMGYRAESRNGEKLYCQYSAPLGTHISRMHCLSAELMAQAARDDEEIQNKLSQRSSTLCPSCIQKNN